MSSELDAQGLLASLSLIMAPRCPIHRAFALQVPQDHEGDRPPRMPLRSNSTNDAANTADLGRSSCRELSTEPKLAKLAENLAHVPRAS